MKQSLPLLAVLTATLATPVLAQDMSSFLNPGALAARMGLASPSAASAIAPATSLRGADPAAILQAITAPPSRGFETATYISASPRPLMRPDRFAVVPVPSADTAALIDDMVHLAPHGASTTVVSGANTAVISGADTAIITSNGVTSAATLAGDSPRQSWWRRLFGL